MSKVPEVAEGSDMLSWYRSSMIHTRKEENLSKWSIPKASKTAHTEWKQHFCDFHSSLLRMVSCCSLCILVWDILKHQFEHMVYTPSHFAALSGILTLEFRSSWSEAYLTSPFVEGGYNIKLRLFGQENMFLVMTPTLESMLKKLSFCSAQ